jgi:hypothetical protein
MGVKIFRICAWCKKLLDGDKVYDREEIKKMPITHGICKNCAEMLNYSKIDLNDFINSLNIPVLIVNDGIVENANKDALNLLQKEDTQVVGFKGGDVFECIYASTPEGCGKTIHCTGCTIRNSVTETFISGVPIVGKDAFQFLNTVKGVIKVHLEISTEKVQDKVLLHIGSMKLIDE